MSNRNIVRTAPNCPCVDSRQLDIDLERGRAATPALVESLRKTLTTRLSEIGDLERDLGRTLDLLADAENEIKGFEQLKADLASMRELIDSLLSGR